jgi:hypothetical protein
VDAMAADGFWTGLVIREQRTFLRHITGLADADPEACTCTAEALLGFFSLGQIHI